MRPKEFEEDDEDSFESSGMEKNSHEMDDSKDHDVHHRHHLTSTPHTTVTVQNSITIAETTIKTMHNSAMNFHSTKTCLIFSFITFVSFIVHFL